MKIAEGCCRPPTWRGTSGAAGCGILEGSRAPDGGRSAGGRKDDDDEEEGDEGDGGWSGILTVGACWFLICCKNSSISCSLLWLAVCLAWFSTFSMANPIKLVSSSAPNKSSNFLASCSVRSFFGGGSIRKSSKGLLEVMY